MSYLPSLPAAATLGDVFAARPEAATPLLLYHQAILRGPSPLSEGEPELMGAYVSGLNDCAYCHGIHAATAARFGVEASLLGALLADVDTAPVDSPLKPLLKLAAKLTRSPSRVEAADAEAVFAAGWPEQALFDTVSVAALFNLMNRLVEGLGIEASPDYVADAAEPLQTTGYAAYARRLKAGGAGT